MIKKIMFLPVRVISFLAGFIFIASIPVLLTFNHKNMSIELHISSFIGHFVSNLYGFIHFSEIQYLIKYLQNDELHKYLYSMSLLSISLILVSISGIVISSMIMMLPESIRHRFKRFIDFSTTTPELLIMFMLQYVTIYVYKTYGIKLFRLYGGVHNEPYFEPITIITFLPTIFLIQFLLKEFSNEEQKDYVSFAKAKGVPLSTIYIKHIFPNVFPLFLIHLKTIVWYLLTNTFVVINVFNMLGIFGIHKYLNARREMGVNFILELMLFAIPIILCNLVAQMVTRSMSRKE